MRKLWIAVIIAIFYIAATGISSNSAQKLDPFSAAAEQAGIAARSRQLSQIHLRLQLVLNCFEGSGGMTTGTGLATIARVVSSIWSARSRHSKKNWAFTIWRSSLRCSRICGENIVRAIAMTHYTQFTWENLSIKKFLSAKIPGYLRDVLNKTYPGDRKH